MLVNLTNSCLCARRMSKQSTTSMKIILQFWGIVTEENLRKVLDIMTTLTSEKTPIWMFYYFRWHARRRPQVIRADGWFLKLVTTLKGLTDAVTVWDQSIIYNLPCTAALCSNTCKFWAATRYLAEILQHAGHFFSPCHSGLQHLRRALYFSLLKTSSQLENDLLTWRII